MTTRDPEGQVALKYSHGQYSWSRTDQRNSCRWTDLLIGWLNYWSMNVTVCYLYWHMHVHWRRLVKNIGGGNKYIEGWKKVTITEETIGVSQLLGTT